jgi:CBS domain-containing protein
VRCTALGSVPTFDVMKLRVLALDYDGTIARDGALDAEVRAAIADVRALGCVVVLATGRILDDLRCLVGDLTLFDAIVAENGAVVAYPGAGRSTQLAPTAPGPFVTELWRRNLVPRVGACVVELPASDAEVVLQVVRELELPLTLHFNDGEDRVGAVITDRDICMGTYTRGRPLAELRVADSMSRRLVTCTPDDDVASAVRLMVQHQLHRLPVVDAKGKACGVLSLNDLALDAAHDDAIRAGARGPRFSAGTATRRIARCRGCTLVPQQAGRALVAPHHVQHLLARPQERGRDAAPEVLARGPHREAVPGAAHEHEPLRTVRRLLRGGGVPDDRREFT